MSKDLTLPFGSSESCTWILRKTILCLVLEIPGYTYGCFQKYGYPQIIPILIGFSIINHPFWDTPIFGNIHISFFTNFQRSLHRGLWGGHGGRRSLGWGWEPEKSGWERTWRIISGFCGSDHSHVYASLHIGHVWPCKGRGPTTLEGTKTITMVINHWQNQVLGWSSSNLSGNSRTPVQQKRTPSDPYYSLIPLLLTNGTLEVWQWYGSRLWEGAPIIGGQ